MASNMELEDLKSGEIGDQYWTLYNIPKELFLHICSFVSAKFVVDVLSKVCLRFKYLIEDDSTWRIRLLTRWPHRYPIIRMESFSWRKACCAREEQHRLWNNSASNMKKYHIKSAHFAAVDVVHVISKGHYCVSGSRDHSIKLWNLEELVEHQEDDAHLYQLCEAQKDEAHAGWIWSMAYSASNQTLYSGAWDSLIKSWDINDFSSHKQTFSVPAAVLCLTFSENILVSGSYDKVVSFFDPRSGATPFFRKALHKKAVLCITADEKFVISGSEDHSVVVYDITAGKVHSTIELEGYPMSMSYEHSHLWIGDNLGCLSIIDPTEQKFQLVNTYPSGHRSQVSGVHYSLGSIITSSLDKTMRILQPTNKLKSIASFEFTSGVAGISAYGDIVANANSDDSITIWLPKYE